VSYAKSALDLIQNWRIIDMQRQRERSPLRTVRIPTKRKTSFSVNEPGEPVAEARIKRVNPRANILRIQSIPARVTRQIPKLIALLDYTSRSRSQGRGVPAATLTKCAHGHVSHYAPLGW
jgi:hypothetical protein